MTRASIVGAGMTKFGTHADVTLAELFAEAVLPAFDDAGIDLIASRRLRTRAADARGAVPPDGSE